MVSWLSCIFLQLMGCFFILTNLSWNDMWFVLVPIRCINMKSCQFYALCIWVLLTLKRFFLLESIIISKSPWQCNAKFLLYDWTSRRIGRKWSVIISRTIVPPLCPIPARTAPPSSGTIAAGSDSLPGRPSVGAGAWCAADVPLALSPPGEVRVCGTPDAWDGSAMELLYGVTLLLAAVSVSSQGRYREWRFYTCVCVTYVSCNTSIGHLKENAKFKPFTRSSYAHFQITINISNISFSLHIVVHYSARPTELQFHENVPKLAPLTSQVHNVVYALYSLGCFRWRDIKVYFDSKTTSPLL